jgi:hypothetical protein
MLVNILGILICVVLLLAICGIVTQIVKERE